MDTKGRAPSGSATDGLHNSIELILLEIIYQGEQYGYSTDPNKLFRVSRPLWVFFRICCFLSRK